jgi:hypothetical protein
LLAERSGAAFDRRGAVMLLMVRSRAFAWRLEPWGRSSFETRPSGRFLKIRKTKNPAAWAGFQTQGAKNAPGRSDQLQTSTRRKRQP